MVSKQRIEDREKTVWDGHAASRELVMNAARDLASSDQQMAIIAKLKGIMYACSTLLPPHFNVRIESRHSNMYTCTVFVYYTIYYIT